MKKILGLMLSVMLMFVLSACGIFGGDEVPQDVIDCALNPEAEECQDVIDDITDDDRTPQEILIDTIIENYNDGGNLTFLSTAIESMNFDSALAQTTELYFEVSEDVDETHYVNAIITDKMNDDNDLLTIERTIYLDINDEDGVEFTMYIEETLTGVNVYIETAPIFEAIADGDQAVLDYVSWIGFNDTYAVFNFDDTIENIIEIEVLKDMLENMFYDEFGADVFDQLQADISTELDVVLADYAVDLDEMAKALIDEDFVAFETLWNAIDFDGIILELDKENLVPEIVNWMNTHSTELTTAGFNVPNEVTQIQTDGTELYLDGLTTAELDSFTEIVIKPMIETTVYHMMMGPYNQMQEIEVALDQFMTDYSSVLLSQHSVNVSMMQTELQDNGLESFYDTYGSYLYYLEMVATTDEEWEMLDSIYDVMYVRGDLLDFFTTHETALNTAGVNATALKAELTSGSLEGFYDLLTVDDVAAILDPYIYDKVDGLKTDFDNDELVEGLLEVIFTDIHVTSALAEIPDFDGALLATNMLLIDADAIINETLDIEALYDAVYEGETAFNTYVTNLETTAPNLALILEPFGDTVLMLEDYQSYMDDMMYAFDGMSVFEDYFDLSTYLNDDMMEPTLSRTDDATLLVEMEMDNMSYQMLLEDILLDVHTYLDGYNNVDISMYDEHMECLATAVDCYDEFPYSEVIDELNDLESIYMTMEYNPSVLNEMNMTFDLTDLFNQFAEESYADISSETGYTPDNNNDDITGVNEFTINVTLSTEAVVTLPATADNVNDLMTEFSKLAIVEEAYDFMLYTEDYYGTNTPAQGVAIKLDDLPFFPSVSAAIDSDASTITYNGTTYVFDAKWIDGTTVFDSPLVLTNLKTLYPDWDITSETSFDALLALVDDTNYSVTKLFLYFFFEE